TDQGSIYNPSVFLNHNWTSPLDYGQSYNPWYHSRERPIEDPISRVSHGSLYFNRCLVLQQRHYKVTNNSYHDRNYHHIMNVKLGKKHGVFKYLADNVYVPRRPNYQDTQMPFRGLYVMVVAYPEMDDGLLPMRIRYMPHPEYDQLEDIDVEQSRYQAH